MYTFSRILVPVDYSAPADAALRLAAELATAFQGRLLVLHLLAIEVFALAELPLITSDVVDIEEARERLRTHVAKVLGPEAPPYDVAVTWGSPYLQIVDHAIEYGADLIVLGTHGRTGLKHVLLGSVAEKTVRLAPCPVLTVRNDARATAGDRPASEGRGRVAERMERAPVTVRSDDTLDRARARMAEARVRHLPVVDGERIVGMLSDADLGPHVGQLERTRVHVAMTPRPITVSAAAGVEEAARLMLTHRVRALPVIDGARLVGVISSTDILEDYVRVARV
jgi:nucleotide-binding universal stress UspA family protein/CBS domain-containing protein